MAARLPTANGWSIVQQELPAAGDGEFVIEVDYLSIDPAMRVWMNAGDTYMSAMKIDEVMRSMAIGTVVESRSRPVLGGRSGVWHVRCAELTRCPTASGVSKVDAIGGARRRCTSEPWESAGSTAYSRVCLTSGARNRVRPYSCPGRPVRWQHRRPDRCSKGCRTIGIAGGEDKCRRLVDELGFDAAIDYKTADLRAELKAHAPDGVRRVFRQRRRKALEAALDRLARGARIVLSGAVSQYNGTPHGPANYMQLTHPPRVAHRLRHLRLRQAIPGRC